MCKGLVVVYRSQDETTFFVVGSDEENEVILVRAPEPSEGPLERAPVLAHESSRSPPLLRPLHAHGLLPATQEPSAAAAEGSRYSLIFCYPRRTNAGAGNR